DGGRILSAKTSAQRRVILLAHALRALCPHVRRKPIQRADCSHNANRRAIQKVPARDPAVHSQTVFEFHGGGSVRHFRFWMFHSSKSPCPLFEKGVNFAPDSSFASQIIRKSGTTVVSLLAKLRHLRSPLLT